MTFQVRINTTASSPQGEEYRYIQVSLPQDLRDAANLRAEDRLSVQLRGSQIRIKYNPDGALYKHGVVSVNEKNFKHPVNLGFTPEVVNVIIEGDELVVNVPDSAFLIKRGFDSINKGFEGVQA